MRFFTGPHLATLGDFWLPVANIIWLPVAKFPSGLEPAEIFNRKVQTPTATTAAMCVPRLVASAAGRAVV